jgi:hypothetical protein
MSSHRSPLAQWLVALLVTLELPGLTPLRNVSVPTPAPPIRLAGGHSSLPLSSSSRSFKKEEADDKGLQDLPWTPPKVGGFRANKKAVGGAYNPHRVQAFWRHYHGARPEPKTKPLEHEASHAR